MLGRAVLPILINHLLFLLQANSKFLKFDMKTAVSISLRDENHRKLRF